MLPIDVFIRRTRSLDDPPVGVSIDASSESSQQNLHRAVWACPGTGPSKRRCSLFL